MANRIMLNQTSYHGAGAIAEIVNEAKAHDYKKAFVCSDPDLIKFQVSTKVTDLLDQAGLSYEIYSNIKANPTIENVQTGVAAFKKSGADYIIAIGGGSSMDTAKAIGIIIANPEFEDVRSLEGVAPTRKPCVPIIAVPTTAGTAAEVTINYVITDVERKRKFVCVDPHDMPIIAVVDPEMMSSMPKGLTAATGMDALTHAVEGYIGGENTAQTKKDSVEAVQLIHKYLKEAYDHGDNLEARNKMQYASFIAGRAFTRSYVGYVHAIAHTLGGHYGVPHGLANAVILPYVLEAYGKSAHKKLARLADCIGIQGKDDAEKANAFIQWIRDMNSSMNIPDKIRAKDGSQLIKEEDLADCITKALHEANPLYPCPQIWDRKEVEAIFRKIM